MPFAAHGGAAVLEPLGIEQEPDPAAGGAGALAVVMLGLGRALGETMAVTFIIGNAHGFPDSIFASGATLASTIANEFTEATGELHTSALVALGLVLFIITFSVLAMARLLLSSQKY